jgi:hypothetical protein
MPGPRHPGSWGRVERRRPDRGLDAADQTRLIACREIEVCAWKDVIRWTETYQDLVRRLMTIRALVAVAVDLSGRRRSRRAAREHVIRLAWPASAPPLPHPQSQLLGDSMPKDPR